MIKTLWWWKLSPTLLNPRYESLQLKPCFFVLQYEEVLAGGSFVAGYPWIHFLMKWEMCQLPLQMQKEMGTSEADCNNMLHEAEGAMVVDSLSSWVGTFQNRNQGKIWPIALAKWWSLANMLYGKGGLQTICYKRKRKSSIRGKLNCDCDWQCK